MVLLSALRSLRRQPGFVLAAASTLALGLAATTVVFSVVEAVLLKPLPYAAPDRLVFVWQDVRARRVPHFGFSHGDIGDLRTSMPSLEGVAAVTNYRATLLHDDGTPELVVVGSASANLFRVLGVSPRLGPGFRDEDGVPAAVDAGPSNVTEAAVISHTFWQRAFGGREDILGRPLRLDDTRAIVAGVLPPDFELLTPADADVEARPDVWLALRVDFASGQRAFAPFTAIGRLARGAALDDVRRDAVALTADLRRRFPIKEITDTVLVVGPFWDDIVGEARPTLVALLAAVTLVLLVACANVAGLLLARAQRRTREVAVRAALGGSRGQIVRQLMCESAVLAGAGAVMGLALARVGLAAVRAYSPAQVPRLVDATLDLRVAVAAAAAAAVSALIFGLAPALKSARVDLAETLRAGGRAGSGGRHPLRLGLVAGEIAVSFALLVGSMMMIRTVLAMQRVDLGFDAAGVHTFVVSRPLGPTPAARGARTAALRERLLALPGVTAVAVTSALPLDGETFTGPYGPPEAAARTELMRQAEHRWVEAGYFSALKTPLVAGREFTAADQRPDARVVVVDTTLAETLFPGLSAVGQRILVPRVQGAAQPEPFEIIGVVRPHASAQILRPGRETVFMPAGFVGWSRVSRWVVRSETSTTGLAAAVRDTVRAFDGTLALGDEQPFSALVDGAMAPARFLFGLLSAFAALATGLTAIGLYGVLATAVAERTAEIGVRVALGAPRRRVFGMVLRDGLGLASVGIASGSALAAALSGLFRATIVGVAPSDPATFVAVAVLLTMVVSVACLVPAWAAARVDPMVALRTN